MPDALHPKRSNGKTKPNRKAKPKPKPKAATGTRQTPKPARDAAPAPPTAAPAASTALGRALAVRRLELGRTRRQVAEAAGLSYPFVCEIERGAKQPSAASLRALAAAVALSPADLLTRADALEQVVAERAGAVEPGPGTPRDARPATRPGAAWRGPGAGARGGVRAAVADDLAGLVRGLVRDELAHLQAGGAPPMVPRAPVDEAEAAPLRNDEEVRDAVVAAVRTMLGRDDIDFDPEGDIPIQRGEVMLFIRVLDDPLSVLVFAPVLVGVDESLALHERLNELNAGVHFVRFCITHGGVVADVELFGEHVRPALLEAACTAISAVVAEHVGELQDAVGGRRFLGDETVARPRRDTAGYL